VNASADHTPTLAYNLQSGGHKLANRRENDGGVERTGRAFIRTSSPDGTHALGKKLRISIAAAREGIDLAALPDADLGDDVRSRPETIEPNSLGIARL